MRLGDIDERKLTGGEKRSKEAHFKKLKKHKKDFTDRYGDEGESVMHAIATNRAKGESVQESNDKPYICVHAKKGKHECYASSSYEAAKKAAAHWKMKSTAGIDAHLAVEEGWEELPPINREKYGQRDGLEGPIQTRSGKTVYYDPKAGKYYDPDTDMYISYDDWKKLDSKGMYKMDKMTSRHDDIPEAVGSAADSFYNLQDEFAGEEASGAHKVLIDELVRYLSGDQLEDFVADFRRHYDMNESVNESKLTEGVLDDADEDGWMAKSQLYKTAKYAIGLHGMISDTDNLEPWIQAKITRASEDLSSVKHYLEYEAVSPQSVQSQPEMGPEEPVAEAHSTAEFGMFSPEGDAQVQNAIQYILNDFDDKTQKATSSQRDMLRIAAHKQLLKDLEDISDSGYDEAMDTDVRERAAEYLERGIIRIMDRLDDLGEGHSPHKKGTAKYKKHMAAKHAAMAEGTTEQLEKQAIDFFTSIKSKINSTGKK